MTKSIGDLNLEFIEGNYEEELSEGNSESALENTRSPEDRLDGMPIVSDSSSRNSTPESVVSDDIHPEHQMANGELQTLKERASDDIVVPVAPETDQKTDKREHGPTNSEDSDLCGDAYAANRQSEDRRLPNVILPLLRYSQYESSESSCRYLSSLPSRSLISIFMIPV